MLCYGARLSEPFVSYTQRKGTVITMKENQEKKSKLSGLGATLQLGNKPLWKERVSYFFVNLGNIPIMTMVNAYLSIFYTDTLGMDAKVVGTMFLIARVFDGVNDPFIGYFIDRAPNSKFGKFRRILIVGTIICTLNYAVVWMGPAYVSDSMKVMVAYISYMLLGVTFPVMDISLNSMLPVMTNDMEERNFLAMLKNFAYGLGGGLNLIAPIVFAKFNSSVKGYNIMNLLAMGIILSCSLGGITGIHQRVEPLKDAGYKAKDVLRIIKLKPIVAFFIGGLIVQTGLAFVATSNPYYATHALGSIGKLTIMNTVAIVGGPVSLLAVPLAKKIGKTRVIAETGAGQHGVATATAAALFGMECEIYMGIEDTKRQALNVYKMRLLGAKVHEVTTGTGTLKDAVSEAMREWTNRIEDTHYVLGSCMGPHPFPTIVRDFQAVISKEIKEQMLEKEGRLPDAVLACVGGGSNAIGAFYNFIDDKDVQLIGCEAAGRGVNTAETAATIATGRLGIFHGMKSYFCQDEYGQIAPVYSISAGLDYPGIGPEHANLYDTGRAQYVAVTDDEAIDAFEYLSRIEGIIPAIESAHAIAYAMKLAPTMGKDKIIVVNVSGRGDKDCAAIARYRGEDIHE